MATTHSCGHPDEVADSNPFSIEAIYGVEHTDRPRDEQEGRGDAPLPNHALGAEMEYASEAGETRWIKRVFDHGMVITQVCEDENDDRFGEGKQQARHAALLRMAEDPMKGWRPMIAANTGMIAALETLAEGAPNFRALFDIILTAARASCHAGMPLRLPHLLLLGPPGGGKTRIAREIASALETTVETVPVTMQTGTGVLSGLDVSWRNPRLGAVARALLAANTASPVMVIDEVDKASPRSEYGQLLDPLHDLLEVDTARTFQDQYLQVPLAADGVIWLATANDRDAIPAPIQDRMLVIEVKQPTADEMEVILAGMVRAAMARWGSWFEAEAPVGADALRMLRGIHPRAARRVIDLAVGFAVASKRRTLVADDVKRAMHIVDIPSQSSKIGFL